MRMSTRKNARNGHGLASDWLKIKHTFSGAASDVKKNAGSLLNHSVDSLRNHTQKMQGGVSDYTASKPFKALGIALLTGALLGFLIKRR